MTQQKIITVFGGTGFLGRHIVYALARTGATIRVATRLRQRAYFLRLCGSPGQVVPVSCNIHDDASVAAALHGSTHAVNLIGVLAEKGRKNSFEKIHVEAAARIAAQCSRQNIELLVHVSALGAGSSGPSRYARSKAAGEQKISQNFSRAVFLRPSLVFGPEDDFFNRFARMTNLSPVLPLIGGGRTKFQPVYVGDIAAAVAKIISDPDQGKYIGHCYDLGGPDVLTFRQLMEMTLQQARRSARLVTLPAGIAKLMAVFTGFLPNAPLTVDQVRSLSADNVLAPGENGLKTLDLPQTSLAAILPTYLNQYWPGGPFSEKTARRS